MVGKQPIVLLKTADGNRFLPIWIGHPEAAAILMKLQGASTPRPMTHDLMADVLEQHRRQVRADRRHRAPRQHLLRDDHPDRRRHRGRDRLAPLRRPRPRGPLRRADLRGRGGHRGVLDRVRARGRGPGGGRREVQGLPRRGHARGLRRRQRRAAARTGLMRIEESFTVGRPPEQVFDYLTDPATLADWQTTKSTVEQLTPGPPGKGTRFREVDQAAGRQGVRADRPSSPSSIAPAGSPLTSSKGPIRSTAPGRSRRGAAEPRSASSPRAS